MVHTIKKMSHVMRFINDDRKLILLNGYAFLDECGRCIIQVYGEGKRDFLSNHFNNLLKNDKL
jgi:hypothetical protein